MPKIRQTIVSVQDSMIKLYRDNTAAALSYMVFLCKTQLLQPPECNVRL